MDGDTLSGLDGLPATQLADWMSRLTSRRPILPLKKRLSWVTRMRASLSSSASHAARSEALSHCASTSQRAVVGLTHCTLERSEYRASESSVSKPVSVAPASAARL